MNRRRFLTLAAMGILGSTAAACPAPAPKVKHKKATNADIIRLKRRPPHRPYVPERPYGRRGSAGVRPPGRYEPKGNA